MSKRKKNKPDDIIAGRGSEREGACDSDSCYFTHDGSVSVVGEREEECTCRDYCECRECRVCSDCDEYPDDCNCDTCCICEWCDSHIEDCECLYDRVRVCLRSEHRWDMEGLIHHMGEDFFDGGVDEDSTLEDLVDDIMDNDNYDDDMFCSDCSADWDDRYRYDCEACGNEYHRCDMECDCQYNCDCNDGEGTDGEYVSPVLRTQKEMIEWNEENAPYQCNSSCGHHEHRSTKLLEHHSVITEHDFTRYLIKEAYAWARKHKINTDSQLYKRLEGANNYCRNEYRYFEQVLDTEHYPDSRYTFVNYCWQKHGTTEIRLAPEFQKNSLNVAWAVFCDEVITNYINRHKNTVVDKNDSVLF